MEKVKIIERSTLSRYVDFELLVRRVFALLNDSTFCIYAPAVLLADLHDYAIFLQDSAEGVLLAEEKTLLVDSSENVNLPF